MSIAQQSTAALRTPAQVAASIPCLMGFTPAESVVVIMTKSRVVVVTMRVDIPEDWPEVRDHIISTAERIGIDGAVIAVCSESPSAWDDFSKEIRTLTTKINEAGVIVNDALLVQENRIWSFIHDAKGAQGAVFFPEDSSLPMPSTVTREEICSQYELRTALTPSKEVYEIARKHLSGDDLITTDRVLEVLGNLAGREATNCSNGSDLLRAIVHLAMQDINVRDYVLATLVAANDRNALVDALTEAALSSPADLRPKLCGVASAALAATKASTVPASCLVALAGDDSLAQLVDQAITAGINPMEIRDVFISALPEIEERLRNTKVENND